MLHIIQVLHIGPKLLLKYLCLKLLVLQLQLHTSEVWMSVKSTLLDDCPLLPPVVSTHSMLQAIPRPRALNPPSLQRYQQAPGGSTASSAPPSRGAPPPYPGHNAPSGNSPLPLPSPAVIRWSWPRLWGGQGAL